MIQFRIPVRLQKSQLSFSHSLSLDPSSSLPKKNKNHLVGAYTYVIHAPASLWHLCQVEDELSVEAYSQRLLLDLRWLDCTSFVRCFGQKCLSNE